MKYSNEEVENYIVDKELGFVEEDRDIETIIINSEKFLKIRQTQTMLSDLFDKNNNMLFKEEITPPVIRLYFKPIYKYSGIAAVIAITLLILPNIIKTGKSNMQISSVREEVVLQDSSDKIELKKDFEGEMDESFAEIPMEALAARKSSEPMLKTEKKVKLKEVPKKIMKKSVGSVEVYTGAKPSSNKVRSIFKNIVSDNYYDNVKIELNKETMYNYKLELNGKEIKEGTEVAIPGEYLLKVSVIENEEIIKTEKIRFYIKEKINE